MKIMNSVLFLTILFLVGFFLFIGGMLLDVTLNTVQDAANMTGVSALTGPVLSMIRNVFTYIGGIFIIFSIIGYLVITFYKPEQDDTWRG